MKGIGIFILGFVAGVLCTFFVIFLFALGSRNNESQEKSRVEYVEIKGRKGNIQVYTGMPKDSVSTLAGKPDDVDLHSIGNRTYEIWSYKLENKYVPSLEIKFENGKLVGVQEY